MYMHLLECKPGLDRFSAGHASHGQRPLPQTPLHLSALRLCVGLLLAIALPTVTNAQLGTFLRKVLVGDTTAPPDHDTAYITTYRQNFIISAVASYREVSISITDTIPRSVTYSTNNATQFGLALDFKWLSVEASFSVPALSVADPTLGITASRGFALGYTGRRVWGRAVWNSSKGFYPEEPAAMVQDWKLGDRYPIRADLENENWLLSLNYALSKKRRFSQNAALWQIERQKRSAGTWVAGASFWTSRIKADGSLTPTTDSIAFAADAWISSAHRTLLGASIGYAHTFAFWHKGFIHVALLTGAAASRQQRQVVARTEDVSNDGVSSITELRTGAGFNGDHWYAALTTSNYFNSDGQGGPVELSGSYGTVRLAVGMRFGRPRIKGLEKVGL
jgi:Domain of unknown function (DUF4421)